MVSACAVTCLACSVKLSVHEPKLVSSTDMMHVACKDSAKNAMAVCSQIKPRWVQLLLCRNFGSIALVSAVMFMTQNGARAVLLPLLAMQGFGLSAKLLGTSVCMCLCIASKLWMQANTR